MLTAHPSKSNPSCSHGAISLQSEAFHLRQKGSFLVEASFARQEELSNNY